MAWDGVRNVSAILAGLVVEPKAIHSIEGIPPRGISLRRMSILM